MLASCGVRQIKVSHSVCLMFAVSLNVAVFYCAQQGGGGVIFSPFYFIVHLHFVQILFADRFLIS